MVGTPCSPRTTVTGAESPETFIVPSNWGSADRAIEYIQASAARRINKTTTRKMVNAFHTLKRRRGGEIGVEMLAMVSS
jgi:hypothetical protein